MGFKRVCEKISILSQCFIKNQELSFYLKVISVLLENKNFINTLIFSLNLHYQDYEVNKLISNCFIAYNGIIT